MTTSLQRREDSSRLQDTHHTGQRYNQSELQEVTVPHCQTAEEKLQLLHLITEPFISNNSQFSTLNRRKHNAVKMNSDRYTEIIYHTMSYTWREGRMDGWMGVRKTENLDKRLEVWMEGGIKE